MKSAIPSEVFGLLYFLTFSTVQHLSCTVAHGMLPSAVHKQPFPFVGSKR